MNFSKIITPLVIVLATAFGALAQDNNKPSSYDPHDIAITGYLQTQFQMAQKAGISSFSGGDFSENNNNRFLIRRGRLKVDRVDKYTSIVLQLDATQNGVSLMDAFIQLREPKHKEFMLTAGLFNRPFGYSIVYSSGYRLFPERARVFQTIMPRERDIGAMFSFDPKGMAKFLSLDIAVVNGSGYASRDYDSKKDLIGNVKFSFDSLINNQLDLGFGASIYKGFVRSDTKTTFKSSKNGYERIESDSNIGKNLSRDYYGFNAQLAWKNTFGETTLKSEYVFGKQPGLIGDDALNGPKASMSFANQPKTDLYHRNFAGYYFWLSQELGNSKFSAIASYDVYDPNTDMQGTEIGTLAHSNAGDVKFNTLGYGLVYQLNGRVKITAYNEHITNEKTNLAAYQEDIKDDVFTLRLQYRW